MTDLGNEKAQALLFYSALKNDPHGVNTALAAGADPHASQVTDAPGRTALMMAATYGCREVMGILLLVSDLSKLDNRGRTPLMHAATSESPECVSDLLPLFDPNAVDGNGWTALMYAADTGDAGSLLRLLPVTDTEKWDRGGNTALRLARHRGHHECVALIEGFATAQTEAREFGAVASPGPEGPKTGRRL